LSMLSDYLEAALINTVLRGQQYASPVKVYAGLFKSDPTDAGTGVEVSGGGYVRQEITFSSPVDGQTMNTLDILFPVATALWGTITHIGIYDAQTGGNLLLYGPLEFERTIDISSQFKIPASYLIIRLK